MLWMKPLYVVERIFLDYKDDENYSGLELYPGSPEGKIIIKVIASGSGRSFHPVFLEGPTGQMNVHPDFKTRPLDLYYLSSPHPLNIIFAEEVP